ncbi:MAG: hypothetical protein KKC46_00390 [Proteobacteria bacterium]|nr:hypothetical protein [Pseudomonadota bacterium]
MKNLFLILFILLLPFIVSDYSLLYAETYQRNNNDGPVYFRDSSIDVPRDKQVKSNQKSKLPSWMPEQSCMEELENLSNLCDMQPEAKKCMHERLSSECSKQIGSDYSQKATMDTICKQELKEVSVQCVNLIQPQMQQCIHENLSLKCSNQIKKAQNKISVIVPKCYEVHQRFIQKLAACCTGANAKKSCYEKIRLEFEPEIQAACGEMP